MAEEEAEEAQGSILTSPLAILVIALGLLVAAAYVATAVLPGLFAGGASLQPPQSQKAEIISGGVKLSWAPASPVPDKYVIYKSAKEGELGSKAGEVPSSLNSYIDLQVSQGSTYFYTIRSARNDGTEDSGKAQIKVYYVPGSGNQAAPSGLSLKVNGGKQYVNSPPVSLSASAINADKCRFKNENADWSAWESYSPTVSWSLSSGDGGKQVGMQCMNAAGAESQAIYVSLFLDTKVPTMSISKYGKIPNSRKYNITFTPDDELSPSLSCKSYINGIEAEVRGVEKGKQTTVIFNGLATKNTVYISCTDMAGNSAKTPDFTFDVEPQYLQSGTSIKINGDLPETNSVAVQLTLFSQDAYECRLKNAGEDFIAWENYRTSRIWTLTYGNGYKTVLYQCRDSLGQITGQAQDDILLRRSDDGPRDGGGSGGGGSGGEGGEVGAGGDIVITNPNTPEANITLSVNNGAIYTTTEKVTLQLSGGTAQTQCRFRNAGGSDFSPWEAYSSLREWNLFEYFGDARPREPGEDGRYTINVECTGSTTRMGGPSYRNASDSISLDRSTPAVPTSLQAKAIAGGAIDLSWNGSFPAYSPGGVVPSPVVKYNIYKRVHPSSGPITAPASISNAMTGFPSLIANSVFSDYANDNDYLDLYVFYKAGESSSLSWEDRKTINGVTYDYIVKAENQAGSESDESAIATAVADSEKPSITIYSPISQGSYTGRTVSLSFGVRDNAYPMDCTYQLKYLVNGKPTDLGEFGLVGIIRGIPPEGQSIQRDLQIPREDMDYRLYLTCTDKPGNAREETRDFFVYSIPSLAQKKANSGPTSPSIPPGAQATPVYS